MLQRSGVIASLIVLCCAGNPRPSLADAPCSMSVFEADRGQAIKNCNFTLSRDNLSSAERAEALKIRGRVFHKTERLDDAIRDYEAALKLSLIHI